MNGASRRVPTLDVLVPWPTLGDGLRASASPGFLTGGPVGEQIREWPPH